MEKEKGSHSVFQNPIVHNESGMDTYVWSQYRGCPTYEVLRMGLGLGLELGGFGLGFGISLTFVLIAV